MFRQQGALRRGFIKKDYEYYMYLGARRTWALYVLDSDMLAHVNVRRGVRDGLAREIMVTIQRVLNLVEMFLRAGEFVWKQEVFKVRVVTCRSW